MIFRETIPLSLSIKRIHSFIRFRISFSRFKNHNFFDAKKKKKN